LTEQPVDNNIFEYIFDRYDIKITIEPEAMEYKKRILSEQYGFEDGPVAPRKKELNDSGKNSLHIKRWARELGADLVGIAPVKKEYFFKGRELPHSFDISLALEMDYDRIQESPGTPSATEGIRAYCVLGDAVLKTILVDKLMKKHRLKGEITEEKKKYESEEALSKLAEGFDIGSFILTNKGEEKTGADKQPRVQAETLEALIGAMFLDRGYNKTKEAVLKWFHI